ncbi:tRNA epoxyqueuosine(34) reductase QueG [Citromicrobium bathyomarinum]|uniref:tRNA epoxyqueuosine(34) reductase QueG n=1 Tax=Citromicrobium bathyomarinum TaxID=72174 RepID=UPI003159CC41
MPTAATIDQLQTDLVEKARELGFVSVAFAGAHDDPVMAERLSAWLEAGYHGSMGWMERDPSVRAGPQGMWPEARSVIALGASYAPSDDPLVAEPGDRARISVYAQGQDYHVVLKKALKALARWLVAEAEARGLGNTRLKLFVDTAPVMEKPLAQRAGVGWQGKHTNLVSMEHGSWLFLGAVYTTLPFEPDGPHEDRCGSCRACQDACPTDAFPHAYRIDARRCISYLTIEHDGPIPEEFRKAIGNRIYGCDECLAVCPWNKFAQSGAANRAFLPRAELVRPRLADLLTLDDAGFRVLFSKSPIKRIGRNRFVRNCLIAAGNSGEAELLAPVEALLEDPDPVVGEAAQWAVARLKHNTPIPSSRT